MKSSRQCSHPSAVNLHIMCLRSISSVIAPHIIKLILYKELCDSAQTADCTAVFWPSPIFLPLKRTPIKSHLHLRTSVAYLTINKTARLAMSFNLDWSPYRVHLCTHNVQHHMHGQGHFKPGERASLEGVGEEKIYKWRRGDVRGPPTVLGDNPEVFQHQDYTIKKHLWL